MTKSEMKSFMGTILKDLDQFNVPRIDRANETILMDIPTNWTAYEQWPDCIHPI
jgi:hypothetical protein